MPTIPTFAVCASIRARKSFAVDVEETLVPVDIGNNYSITLATAGAQRVRYESFRHQFCYALATSRLAPRSECGQVSIINIK
jgi:hypothetical protein